MAADTFLVERSRLVKAEDARLASFDVIPGSGGQQFKQLTLFWPFSDVKLAESACRYLRLCTSTLNKTAPRQWVENPLGSIEEYAGIYRQASLKLGKHGPEPGILQVLREGFIQELPSTVKSSLGVITGWDESKDDEAKLVSFTRDTTTGMRKLTRVWNVIDPDYLVKIESDRFQVRSVTNPRVDVWDSQEDPLKGQKYLTGVFVVSKRYSAPVEGDVVCALYEELTENAEVDSLTDLQAVPPKIIVAKNEVRELFTTATGDDDQIVLAFRSLSSGSRGYCMGERDTMLESLVDARTWAQGTAYRAGHQVYVSDAVGRYLCLKDHTAAAAFATDLTAGYWKVWTGDYPEWKAATSYAVGDRVLSGATGRYLCKTAHTSAAAFATDLATGEWTTLDGWSYADRQWKDEDDNTGTFYVMLRRAMWQTGTAASNAEVVAHNEGIGRQLAGITRVWLRLTKAARDRVILDYDYWATGTAYAAGDYVTYGTLGYGLTGYYCKTAHTASAEFDTDVAAGRWQPLPGPTYSAWVTSTAYVLGDVVKVSTIDYLCAEAHTSGDFATDLAAGKWIVLQAAWVTATAYAVGDQVEVADGDYYKCTVAHTSGTWATDLAAGKWEAVDEGGVGLEPYTYRGQAYSHTGWRSNEIGDGGWTVSQELVVPNYSVRIHDRETAGIIDVHEEILAINPFSEQRCLVTTTARIYSNPTAAKAYADDSDLVYDQNSIAKTRGKVHYLGNNRWEAHLVKIAATSGPPW